MVQDQHNSNGKVTDVSYPLAQHLQQQPDILLAAEHFEHALNALGLDMTDSHLANTPFRMARMYARMLGGGEPFTLTTFPTDSEPISEDGDIILVRDIPLTSFCAHHLLPFTGVVHVGYIPHDRIAGLSKIARVVDDYAKRPQVQERLTGQIADALMESLTPSGVGVVVSARHACMELRGIRAAGALTVTSTFRGTLSRGITQSRFWSSVQQGL